MIIKEKQVQHLSKFQPVKMHNTASFRILANSNPKKKQLLPLIIYYLHYGNWVYKVRPNLTDYRKWFARFAHSVIAFFCFFVTEEMLVSQQDSRQGSFAKPLYCRYHLTRTSLL